MDLKQVNQCYWDSVRIVHLSLLLLDILDSPSDDLILPQLDAINVTDTDISRNTVMENARALNVAAQNMHTKNAPEHAGA